MHHIQFFIIIVGLLFIPSAVYAGSIEDLVRKGNTAYSKGMYDKALEAYEEAAVDAPESPHIYFNKGTVFYRNKDYTKAAEAFKQAAVKSKDIKLEAESKFNLGLCSFREAERQQDSDLDKALDACAKSIRHFQEAREIIPDFTEAAENIEVVRLTMKSILDEIKKQKEAAEKQQAAMEKAEEQLKALIEKQETLLERNKHLTEKKGQEEISEELKNQMAKLAEDQSDLRQETLDIEKQLFPPQQTQTTQSSPTTYDTVKRHLENAADEQETASERIKKHETDSAQINQQKAIEELKNALKPPGENKKQPGQDQQAGKNRQQETQSIEDQPKDKAKEKSSQQQMVQLPDDAQQILDEERENKKMRQQYSGGGFRKVDKDW